MNFGSNLGGLISPVFTPWLAARAGWEMALALAALLAIVGALLWLGITIDPAEEKPATSEAAWPSHASAGGADPPPRTFYVGDR